MHLFIVQKVGGGGQLIVQEFQFRGETVLSSLLYLPFSPLGAYYK